MIVVLVYRPEARMILDELEPLDGVEVYGCYIEAENKYVMEMIDQLKVEHPDWHFQIEPNEKLKVGFHTEKLDVPKQAGFKE
jgi:hypothetical protein